MSWIIVLSIGFVAGILFASAYPEMASEINETVAPPLQSAGEMLANKIKDGALSLIMD